MPLMAETTNLSFSGMSSGARNSLSGQDDDLGPAHHGVEVVRRGDAVAVELRVVEVAGVTARRAEAFEHLLVADVPAYALSSVGELFDEGRCPASVADDGAAGFRTDFVFHAGR